MTIRCFLMAAICLSCLGCQGANTPNSEDRTTATADSPAAIAPVESVPRRVVVYAYYFHQTFRCYTCQSLEEAAARVIQENFAQPIQAGQMVWLPVNIDKPEGKVLRQQFDAWSSDLVLARVEDGVCKGSKKLDELLGLRGRPDAFSKYLIDEVSASLAAGGG
jgi:hypothetical protein